MKTFVKYAFALAGAVIGVGISKLFYGASLTPSANSFQFIGNLIPAIAITGTCAFAGKELAKNIFKAPTP